MEVVLLVRADVAALCLSSVLVCRSTHEQSIALHRVETELLEVLADARLSKPDIIVGFLPQKSGRILNILR